MCMCVCVHVDVFVYLMFFSTWLVSVMSLSLGKITHRPAYRLELEIHSLVIFIHSVKCILVKRQWPLRYPTGRERSLFPMENAHITMLIHFFDQFVNV